MYKSKRVVLGGGVETSTFEAPTVPVLKNKRVVELGGGGRGWVIPPLPFENRPCPERNETFQVRIHEKAAVPQRGI